MDTNFYQNWNVRKPASAGPNGVVTSHHKAAAEAGAQVLREGGNAIDAAVATSMAVSALEPWMSGIGGGSFMLIYLAKEKTVRCINAGMISPKALNPADYKLATGGGEGGDLFTWPAVEGDLNVHGYKSVGVPGHVDGISMALEKYGTRSWSDTLQPAIELAERGLPINWMTTVFVASAARDLRAFDTSREIYLPDGLPACAVGGKPIPHTSLGNLAKTFRRLAKAGPRDLYEGEIAGQIATDMAAGGGSLAFDDLAAYRAFESDPISMDYSGATVHAVPGMTAGPTLFDVLNRISGKISRSGTPTAKDYETWATAMQQAYVHRFAEMGDIDDSRDPACTTHLSAMDKDGNIVCLTQTLLSLFGSKVVLPQSGILMNNGIMWFDPRPGRPNSIGPAKRPLSNMCPIIVTKNDQPWFAVGASGGRKIMSAVMQVMSMMVDCGMDMEDAFHHPRIDYCGDDRTSIDVRLGADVEAAIAAHMPVVREEVTAYPNNFSKPNAVMRDLETGEFRAIGDISNPVAGSAAA